MDATYDWWDLPGFGAGLCFVLRSSLGMPTTNQGRPLEQSGHTSEQQRREQPNR